MLPQPQPFAKVRKPPRQKGGGGGSLVKYQLNHSQNSSTSVKLIEKPFITGCLSDMLAVCHLSPECPYYLWHIRCDVFCGSGNKVEPPPPLHPQPPLTGPHHQHVSFDPVSASLSSCHSFRKGQMVRCATTRLTEEVLIFVDDTYASSVSLPRYVFFFPSKFMGATGMCVCVCLQVDTSHHWAVYLTHSLSQPTSEARRGPSGAEGPGKDLSDGPTTKKTCAQAELRMIYRAYFWEW